MTRRFLVLLVGIALVAACTEAPASRESAPAPTGTATGAPTEDSAGPTRATATAPPATEPAATPTEPPTVAPTDVPAPTPAETPPATASPPASTATTAPLATATPPPGPACDVSRAPWSSFSQAAREEARDRVRRDDGTFIGRYTGVVRSQDGIQVDHIVPRNYACRNGGHAWDGEQVREFLNDQDNLAVVASSENLRKGDSGPADYLPALDRCWYAARWEALAERYGLVLPERDRDRLDEVLGEAACAGYADATATPTPTPTPAQSTTTTYASCEEAEDAGVERVQGSRGSGKGFPASVVPDARDGDGDGVVCER